MAKLRHQPIEKDDWLRIIRRAELPFTTKAIAMHLAIFANQDGSNARPGETRMAAESGLTIRAVREHLEVLRNLGLTERVNRGTAIRGRADVYQLTVPGAGHGPVPMRWDPDGNRLTPERPKRKRAKKPAPPTEPAPPPAPVEQQAEPEVTGTEVPETESLTGTPVPVDNPVTGTPVPVDNAPHRHPGSGNHLWLVPTYRNPGTDLPEPVDRLTGTPVPPTTHTNHDQPPMGSLQVSTSPVEAHRSDDDTHNTVDQGLGTAADDELEHAQTVLAAMRRHVATAWRLAARRELETADIPLTKRTVEIRAADLATRPADTAAGGAA